MLFSSGDDVRNPEKREMGSLRLKLRYVRHPYLILRTFIGWYERKFDKRIRLGEYGRYAYATKEGLQKLLGIDGKKIEDLMGQYVAKTEFRWSLSRARELLRDFRGGMSEESCMVLYIICRVLRPKAVMETGCGNGFSSASILQALEDNGTGELYSIDLHYREGVTVPRDKELGWVIPENLKHRWYLVLGESFRVLPSLLKKLQTVDLFLHDSRHTYRTMMKEFTIVWPYLRKGGLLVSHDVTVNDAFLDFCDKVQHTPVIIGNIGLTVK